MLSLIFNIGLIQVMDDYSWMYWDSSKGLRMIDYCNGVEGFINYTLSNLKILVKMILDVHVRGVKIKIISI
jgi:hypothetical protein